MTQIEALLLSIAIEATAAWLLLAVTRWGRPARGAAAAALGTLLTHWAAWSACERLMDEIGYGQALVMVEAAVIGVEWIVYRLLVPLPTLRALAASAAVNATSTLAGLALYALDLA